MPSGSRASILVDCFARFLEAPDFPIGAPIADLAPALEIAEDDTGRGVMIDLFAPVCRRRRAVRRSWAKHEHGAATPGSTRAIVRLIYESDVREVLPAIRVPTLVIHREAAMGFTVEHGWYLAERIPGAKYVELPGADNLIWAGDQDAIIAEIQDFVTGIDRRSIHAGCSRP